MGNSESNSAKPFSTMWECMKAHSDYYHPYLALHPLVNGEGWMSLSRDSPLVYKMVEGGACKELWRAWLDCDEKDSHKCSAMMFKCMQDHSDQYRDFLEECKAEMKLVLKELEASLPNEGDEFEVRYSQFMTGGPCKKSCEAWMDSVGRNWKQSGFNYKAFYDFFLE